MERIGNRSNAVNRQWILRKQANEAPSPPAPSYAGESELKFIQENIAL